MAWWEGTQEAGLERAMRLGLGPPPGSMPTELSNAYRMAPREHDPWSFDAPKGPTRGELVAGWQRQAAEDDRTRREEANERRQSEMAGNLRQLASRPQRRRRRPTMQDAGDALAAWEQDEYARMNRLSGIT